MKRIKFFSCGLLCLLSGSAVATTCVVNVIDEWESGFKTEITIKNTTDTALNNWTFELNFDANLSYSDGWNASYECNGTACSVTPPQWQPVIAAGDSYEFGFIFNKANGASSEDLAISADVCNNIGTASSSQNWTLNSDESSVRYVSVKAEHNAEVNRFIEDTGESAALAGSIDVDGQALLSIDLNEIDTGVDIRDGRLLEFLFETDLLPKAYFNTHIDLGLINELAVGSYSVVDVNGTLSLHAISQSITAQLLIVKQSQSKVVVSTLKPITVSSEQFDLSYGIETLRNIANLSSIGGTVPVYFHLVFESGTDQALVNMPAPPSSPSNLAASFDEDNAQSLLSWQDNADNESDYLVRRRPVDGVWQTSAELKANSNSHTEGTPDAGNYEYKVIALNDGVPSPSSNVASLTATDTSQLIRGQDLFQTQCAGCHGTSGQGVGNFPALNTERDVDAMISYIVQAMPRGNPTLCDESCAEDIAVYIQTLWVTDTMCDVSLTPTSYGARQLKVLTRKEYQRSVEDLLGVDFDASVGLSADNKVGFFTNNTYAAIVPSSYSNYLLVAADIAQWAADRDFQPAFSCSSFDQNCADTFIEQLAPQIIRRPLSEDEATTYTAMANGSYTSGDVKAGIQMALEGLLSSPQFLYRHELGEPNPTNAELDADSYELTSYEMATFLSYTFTGSTPDAALLEAAKNDELRNEAQIIFHAQRLAAQADDVMGQFVGSWLGTSDLALAAKDSQAWAGFEQVVPHMVDEMAMTFAHVMLDESEQFSSLYQANYTYLNQTLAEHYGVDGVTGNDMRLVPTSDRGGILANGAFMARWGESLETSPILRAVRVRRRMLCQDQPDPPAGTFAAREQKLAELADLLQDPTTTNRLKYHRLTEDSPCTNCHTQYINPLGFGMEDFDTVGRNRSQDLNGNPIDASGALYAPEKYSDLDIMLPFNGTMELANEIVRLSSAQSCLPKQMFRYVTGVGHDEIDTSNPEGPQLSTEEKSGYACEIDSLTDTLVNDSPRAMLEQFGSLKAVRYRKAWARD